MKVMEIMKECGGNVVAKKWDLNAKWQWRQGKGWWWSIKGSAGECSNDQWWCGVQQVGTLMCLKYNGGPKQAMATGGSESDWDPKNIRSVKSESSDLSHGWLRQITCSDLDSWTALAGSCVGIVGATICCVAVLTAVPASVCCVSVVCLLCVCCASVHCAGAHHAGVHCALHWRSCFALAFIKWAWHSSGGSGVCCVGLVLGGRALCPKNEIFQIRQA